MRKNLSNNELFFRIKNIDLSAYALKTDLDNYALLTDLDNYALLTDLANYATIVMLADYATIAMLSDYATITMLSDYATITMLSSYALLTDLDDYLLISETTSTPTANKVPIADVNGKLNDWIDVLDFETVKSLLGVDYLIKYGGTTSGSDKDCDYTNIPSTLTAWKVYGILKGTYTQSSNITFQTGAKLKGFGNNLEIIVDFNSTAYGFKNTTTPYNTAIARTGIALTRDSKIITNLSTGWSSFPSSTAVNRYIYIAGDFTNTDGYGGLFQIDTVDSDTQITLKGKMQNLTGNFTTWQHTIMFTCDDIEISNLTILNCTSSATSAIYFVGISNSKIDNLIIKNCTASTGNAGAIWIYGGYNSEITNCDIQSCEGVEIGGVELQICVNIIFGNNYLANCKGNAGGLYLVDCRYITVSNNKFISCYGNGGGGMLILGATLSNIFGNSFIRCDGLSYVGGGVYIGNYGPYVRCNFFNNSFYNCWSGTGSANSIYVEDTYSMIHSNRFLTNRGGGNIIIGTNNDAQDNYLN